MSAKLIYCSECKINTVHHNTPRGEWVCWCGNADPDPAEIEAEVQMDVEWLQIDRRQTI